MRIKIICYLLFISFICILGYSATYGPPTRIALNPDNVQYPLSATGFISTRENITCSAQLVGECYVLSNSHCSGSDYYFHHVDYRKGGKRPGGQRPNGLVDGMISSGKVVIDGGYRAQMGSKNIQNDYLLIKLNVKIGSVLGYMRIKKISALDTIGKLYASVSYDKMCNGTRGYGCLAMYEVKETHDQYYNDERWFFQKNVSTEKRNMIGTNADLYAGSSGAGGFYISKEDGLAYLETLTHSGQFVVDTLTGRAYEPSYPENEGSYENLTKQIASEQFYEELTSFMEEDKCSGSIDVD